MLVVVVRYRRLYTHSDDAVQYIYTSHTRDTSAAAALLAVCARTRKLQTVRPGVSMSLWSRLWIFLENFRLVSEIHSRQRLRSASFTVAVLTLTISTDFLIWNLCVVRRSWALVEERHSKTWWKKEIEVWRNLYGNYIPPKRKALKFFSFISFFTFNSTNKLLTLICLFIVQLLWLCDLYKGRLLSGSALQRLP